MFEGEYFNEEINGKRKEYSVINGQLLFEGEYLNGIEIGKIKEFYYDGELKYEGEYLYNHKRKGKEYINKKLEYEGEYLFDKKWNGKGYDGNGNILYELKDGNGKVKEYDYYGELEYEGEYLNGKKNGKGKEYNKGVLEYEGEYLNGLKNGKGKEFDSDGKLISEVEYISGEKKIL